jgi:cellulose synthase/poly-beta-1,6-N-acetylglucosamine synthase-like glycosyltransferase
MALPGESATPPTPSSVLRCGVVAIGRNEGQRLRRCLESLRQRVALVVYVDSGSTDGSAALAEELGVTLVALDMTRPFTAARARNAGLERLLGIDPATPVVQFIDGDCEVREGWLENGLEFLATHPDVAAVCGRVRESFPERSIYNRLCDMGWNTPVGESRACGGNVMLRVEALGAAGGFREEMIAGEEAELCVRLRACGWRVWRHEAEMVLHDAAMMRFSQWWRRGQRTGFAFAEGARMHGAPPERHWVREARRSRIWAGAIPLGVLLGVVFFGPLAWLFLLVYPLQALRIAAHGEGPLHARALCAFFLVLAMFPEALGQLRYLALRLRGRRSGLIEYK